MWHFIKICFQDKQRERQALWEAAATVDNTNPKGQVSNI